MESESSIYAAIAAGDNHVGDFYEELELLGRSSAEIERGVASARALFIAGQQRIASVSSTPCTSQN